MVYQIMQSLHDKYPNDVIGQGVYDAIGLVIIPKPIYPDSDGPAAYGKSTEELSILRSIWKKAGLDPGEWFITTAAKNREGDIDNDRLCDIVEAISPRIVVCCGKEALQAFLGPTKAEGAFKGVLPLDGHYIVLYTYDLNKYVENRNAYPEEAKKIAAEIMEHWITAQNIVSNITV